MVQVLVRRGELAQVFHGVIETNGSARAVTADQFYRLLGTDHLPKPPGFPWPSSDTGLE
jgi:hypothetical protein